MKKTRSNKAQAKQAQAQQQLNGTSDSKLARFLDPNSSWDKVTVGICYFDLCLIGELLKARWKRSNSVP